MFPYYKPMDESEPEVSTAPDVNQAPVYPEDVYLGQQQKQEESIGIIRELDPKKVLDMIRHYLNGEIYDEEEGKYVRVFDPLMNEKGIGKYLSIVSAAVSSLVTFSNFKEDDIMKLTLYVCENALPILYVNYKEYGIQDKSNLNILSNQILVMTMAAFRKALGAGDRNVIGRTIQETISTRALDYPKEERKSFFAKLNPFGGR